MSMIKTVLVATGLSMVAFSSQAAVVSYTDGGFSATATIVDDGADRVRVTLAVDETTGILGDIRAWYFDSLTPLFDYDEISGDISGEGTDTSDLGNGSNVNPLGPFQYGLEFGSPGIGSDDISSTSFYLLGSGLTEASFFGQASALRVTSVGPEGDREGSLKLPGVSEVPLPASAFFLLAGLGGLFLARKRFS